MENNSNISWLNQPIKDDGEGRLIPNITNKFKTVEEEDSGDPRPKIQIEAGEISEQYHKSEEVLREEGFYQRNNTLVQVIKSTPSKKIKRDADSYIISAISQTKLLRMLNEKIRWKRLRKNEEGEFVNCKANCPRQVSEGIIANMGEGFPVLSGLINAPTLRYNGSILNIPGYDEQTGLLLLGDSVITIPATPIREDAVKAIELYRKLLSGFPYIDEVSFSVALSAILTGLIRNSIRSSPLFAFTAPKMGSGKTLHADIVGLVATGKNSSKISQAKQPEEEDKRLLAVLMEGDQIICIDNVDRPLESDALSTILTEDEWTARLLGQNKIMRVETCATWLATGNNIQFKGDLSTRVLLCRLDPECEHPEEREFEGNLRKEVLEKREELIKAGLTILKAYHQAGRPKQQLKPYGRFEEWSDLVRSALVWCGLADPCESKTQVENSDPVREELSCVLQAWKDCFTKQVPINYAIDMIQYWTRNLTGEELARMVQEEREERKKYETLKDAFISISGGTVINARKIGWYFAKYKNRIENGLVLREASILHGNKTWQVDTVR